MKYSERLSSCKHTMKGPNLCITVKTFFNFFKIFFQLLSANLQVCLFVVKYFTTVRVNFYQLWYCTQNKLTKLNYIRNGVYTIFTVKWYTHYSLTKHVIMLYHTLSIMSFVYLSPSFQININYYFYYYYKISFHTIMGFGLHTRELHYHIP